YWTAVGIVFECASLAGYVVVLWLIAGRATRRIGMAESAQITLAGAAATRLLPTAGAGGAAMTLWTMRRAGLRAGAATRTLLVFLVALYSVFLIAVVLSGAALALGLVSSRGPVALAAIPAVAAFGAITIALMLAARHRVRSASGGDGADLLPRAGRLRTRLATAADTLGGAVHDACRLVRARDARLVG